MCFPGVKDDESPKYEWVMQFYYWCFFPMKMSISKDFTSKKDRDWDGLSPLILFKKSRWVAAQLATLPGGLTPTDKTLFFGPVIGQVSVQEPVSVGWRASPVISHRDDRRRWFWTGPTPSWTMCEGLPRGLPHRLIGGCHVGLWGVTWSIDPINSCSASILLHLNLGSERIWPQLDFGSSFNHLLISWLRPVIVKSSCILLCVGSFLCLDPLFLVISRQLVWLRFSFGLSWSKQNPCIPPWNWPMFVCAGFLNSLGLSIFSTALFFSFLVVKMHCIYGKFNSKPFSSTGGQNHNQVNPTLSSMIIHDLHSCLIKSS